MFDAAHDHQPIVDAINGRRVAGDRAHPRPQRPHQRRRPVARRGRRAGAAPPRRPDAVGRRVARRRARRRRRAEHRRSSSPDTSLRVVHTPGHSPGCCCFHDADSGDVFTGDTLFCGGPGATGRSYSDEPTILRSIIAAAPDAARPHRRAHRPRRVDDDRRRTRRVARAATEPRTPNCLLRLPRAQPEAVSTGLRQQGTPGSWGFTTQLVGDAVLGEPRELVGGGEQVGERLDRASWRTRRRRRGGPSASAGQSTTVGSMSPAVDRRRRAARIRYDVASNGSSGPSVSAPAAVDDVGRLLDEGGQTAPAPRRSRSRRRSCRARTRGARTSRRWPRS